MDEYFGTPPDSPRRDSWTVRIKKDLQESTHNQETRSRGGPKPIVMCRVRRQLRDLNPDHYAAAEFSFGLFDRSPLDAAPTRADKCRISMAAAVLEAMGMTNDYSWEELCEMVVPDPKELQDRYNELERDRLTLKDVRSVLTLDAVFLASFLGSKYDKVFATIFPNLQSAIDPTTRAEKIHPLLLDMFKLENQIPISLIRTVLKLMLEKAAPADMPLLNVDRLADNAFRSICEGAIDNFCSQLPGYDDSKNYSETVDYLECDNFVDCMYRGMAHSLKSKKANSKFSVCKNLRAQNGDDSGSVGLLRNLETKYGTENQNGPHVPSVTNQDWKVDIEHLTALQNGKYSVTSQDGQQELQLPTRSDDRIHDGRLERPPLSRSEHRTTPESNGRTQRPSLTQPRKPGIQFRGGSVHDLESEIINAFKIAPSVRSQAARVPERQPLNRREDGTATSQASRLKSHYLNLQVTAYHEPSPELNLQRRRKAVNLPTVTELRKAGIEFKGEKGYSIHDIEFEKGVLNATLHIPTITMNDDTEIIWRNLVAYEHAHGNENPDFIQFLDFMGRLIDSPDDVMYLRSKKDPVITDNLLGTNKAVAKIFNNTVLQNSYYETTETWRLLHQEIYDFYNKPLRHLYLEFRNTYFSKPWYAVSVVGAMILLVLTFVQTIYSAEQYYQQTG